MAPLFHTSLVGFCRVRPDTRKRERNPRRFDNLHESMVMPITNRRVVMNINPFV